MLSIFSSQEQKADCVSICFVVAFLFADLPLSLKLLLSTGTALHTTPLSFASEWCHLDFELATDSLQPQMFEDSFTSMRADTLCITSCWQQSAHHLNEVNSEVDLFLADNNWFPTRHSTIIRSLSTQQHWALQSRTTFLNSWQSYHLYFWRAVLATDGHQLLESNLQRINNISRCGRCTNDGTKCHKHKQWWQPKVSGEGTVDNKDNNAFFSSQRIGERPSGTSATDAKSIVKWSGGLCTRLELTKGFVHNNKSSHANLFPTSNRIGSRRTKPSYVLEGRTGC